MKKITLLMSSYILVLVGAFFYSFTQTDLSLTFSKIDFIRNVISASQLIGYFNRPLSTTIFFILVLLLFGFYLIFLKLAEKKKLSKKNVWTLLLTTTAVLAFSYNAFSYDLFNYIFDAKIVTYYQQNPYEQKALDYPNDPMLSFMRWTHRVYPYGPVWLGITVPLSFFGFQIFLLTLLLFKSLMAAAFIGSLYFIGKIFQRLAPGKELFGLVFFGLNPLVIIESLVSAHLDIVMIFFCVWSFYLLNRAHYLRSSALLLISIGIKFATGFLVPIYGWVAFMQHKKKKIHWDSVFLAAITLMILTVIVASLRSTFQPWYLVLLLTFATFLSYKYYIFLPSIIFSFIALLTYVPYLYVGNWDPPIPQFLSIMYIACIIISAVIVGIRFAVSKK